MESLQNCPVCWNCINVNSKDYCVTECNHIFHLSCFAKNIACQNYNCPICRKPIIESEKNIQENEVYQEEPPVELSPPNTDGSENDTSENENEIYRKIESHLIDNNIHFRSLVELICFLEHEEFESKSEFQKEADYIFGKFRQIINSTDPALINQN